MSTTTKSPRRVLAFAYLIGLATFRDYAHKFSPKKFTQPQLFACLVLKEFLRLIKSLSIGSSRTIKWPKLPDGATSAKRTKALRSDTARARSRIAQSVTKCS